MYRRVLFNCIAASLATASTPVLAQQSAESASVPTLENIIVTAQRKSEDLQEVPIAISNFAPEDIKYRQIQETLDLVQFIPNAVAQNNTGPGAANSYYMRGLGSSQSLATFDSPVGSYVDDLYIGRQAANNFALFDLERVEVLRGPQGTLFGRNTTGGAVRVLLKKPSSEFGGNIGTSFGSFQRKQVNGSINIPVSDTVYTKFSGYYIDDDGFVDNLETGEDGLNDETNWGLRGAIRVVANDNLTWDGSIDYIENDHANEINFLQGSDRVTFTGIPGDGSTLVSPITGDRLISGEKGEGGPGSKIETFSVISKFDITLSDNYNLEVISAYLDTEQFLLTDVFAGGVGTLGSDFPAFQTSLPEPVRGSRRNATGGFLFGQLGQHDQFTQEIKLNATLNDNIEYVAGIYYFYEDNETEIGQVFTLPSGFPALLADNIMENTTTAWAVYAQADINLTDQLILTLGGRYTDEDRDLGFSDFIPTGAPSDHTTAALLAAGIPDELSTEIFTPRIALSYQATDEFMLFASATRGFKSGGWNASATDVQEVLPFDAEEVWSYEAGFRSEFFDNRVRFNLTAFYLDVSDFQVLSGFQRGDGTFAFLTRNFADLSNTGVEIDMVAAVTDSLTIYGSLGIQDAEYEIDGSAPAFDEFGVQSIAAQQQDCLAQIAGGVDTDSCGVGIVTADGSIADPTRTPDVSGNLGITYTIPAPQMSGTFVINGSLRYFEDHTRATSAPPLSFTGDQTLYNASVGFEFDDKSLSISAGCKNCSDEAYIISTVGPLGWINDPRTWFIDVSYDFGE